ncbi:MAG: hypothetical protein V1776_02790 [Candidatus Diapherotrites archaeon]
MMKKIPILVFFFLALSFAWMNIYPFNFLSIAAISFIVAHSTFPFFIRRMHLQKIVWNDFNKMEGSHVVAGMGGVIVLLSFVFSIMIALAFHSYFDLFQDIDLLSVLAALLTIIMVGLIGMVDDVIGWTKGIRQYQHALFPIFAAFPLMVLPQTIGNTGVDIPFLGFMNFGIIYALMLVPIAVTGASNATNMLAGLNGLEGGMGLLNAFAVLIVALVLGRIEVAIIMVGLIGAVLAFLVYNWTPAKIFPGDSFTLMMGAAIASACVIGNMEKIGIMIFGLYFVELILKGRTKMQAQSFGIIQSDGILKSPEKIGSLTHVVMRMGRFTEKQVVLIILGMQVVVIVITLLLFWLNHTQAIALYGGT